MEWENARITEFCFVLCFFCSVSFFYSFYPVAHGGKFCSVHHLHPRISRRLSEHPTGHNGECNVIKHCCVCSALSQQFWPDSVSQQLRRRPLMFPWQGKNSLSGWKVASVFKWETNIFSPIEKVKQKMRERWKMVKDHSEIFVTVRRGSWGHCESTGFFWDG